MWIYVFISRQLTIILKTSVSDMIKYHLISFQFLNSSSSFSSFEAQFKIMCFQNLYNYIIHGYNIWNKLNCIDFSFSFFWHLSVLWDKKTTSLCRLKARLTGWLAVTYATDLSAIWYQCCLRKGKNVIWFGQSVTTIFQNNVEYDVGLSKLIYSSTTASK